MVDEKKLKPEWDAEAEVLWNEIKELPIEMYSLPGQFVKNHVQRCRVAPNVLHLRTKSSAVLVSLEDSLERNARGYKLVVPKYVVEQIEGYVVVSRAPQPLPKVKPEL